MKNKTKDKTIIVSLTPRTFFPQELKVLEGPKNQRLFRSKESCRMGIKRNKKAVFFSTDALVALTIILLIILIAFPLLKQERQGTNLHYDILTILSSLQMKDLTGIPSQFITDPENTALKQIGELYVTSPTDAKTLANLILNNNVKTNENIGLWYENTLIWSSNSSSIEQSRNIDVARQSLSGIQNGTNVTGFSARAFLTSGSRTEYFYFGGYVGDGNISTIIEYDGNISDTAELELAINNDFTLYVNNNYIEDYSGSPNEFTPVTYSIPTGSFSSGNNTIEFKGEKLHIAGGFIKINYNSDVQYEQKKRYKFPGIEGLINLYDGFYIPGNLTNLEISLRLNNTILNTFLNIGNITVYNGTTNDEETIFLDDTNLTPILNYTKLSYETIPLRLGIENTTLNISTEIDAFSVTDISGSMHDICSYSNPGFGTCCSARNATTGQNYSRVGDCFFGHVDGDTCRICNEPYSYSWTPKLALAKNGTYFLIDLLLKSPKNQVGLDGYGGQSTAIPDFHPISNDTTSLNNTVYNWDAYGGTCICCGINRAINNLITEGNPNATQSMVVMSDGEADDPGCPEQGYQGGSEDAIEAARQAYEENNITVYTIGFGASVDNQTLIQMAVKGNGAYYYSTPEILEDIYILVAETIVSSYIEQTLNISGNIYTSLNPESYIEFTYDETPTPFGLVITAEKQFDNETSGTFFSPPDASVLETRVNSYSGPRWTDKVLINTNPIYDLSSYGFSYIPLGDPYSINIPSSFIQENNTVDLTTALSPFNPQPGSEYNTIINTLVRNASAFSDIKISANGCFWHVLFEDHSNFTGKIPLSYSGVENCYYSNDSFFGQIGSSSISNSNDAFQAAVFSILKQLDLNEPKNNKVDVIFSEQDLEITLTELFGIPFTWSTEVEARTWS